MLKLLLQSQWERSNMTYEAPKRFTAKNDVTGDLIKNKTSNQDAYASGWDRIFGNKNKVEEQEVEQLTTED